jgi:lysophospholipase L1-like esterase
VVALRILLALLLAAQAARAADPRRFAADIAAFEAADKTNPPPQNAILFIGSSSILRWKTLARDFPGHKVINRGFGGSHLADSVYYFDRIVAPYHPRMIVMYAGGNDINAGKTPEEVFDDFKDFAGKVRAALPGTRLDYVSIGISPSRWKDLENVKETNRLIRDYIGKGDRLEFIDVFPAMLGPDGRPKPDIYVADRLHMNAKGYTIWQSIIAPYLDK